MKTDRIIIDNEIKQIVSNAITECCRFCVIGAKDSEFDLVSIVLDRNKNRIITERMHKCYKCFIVRYQELSFIKKFC